MEGYIVFGSDYYCFVITKFYLSRPAITQSREDGTINFGPEKQEIHITQGYIWRYYKKNTRLILLEIKVKISFKNSVNQSYENSHLQVSLWKT